MFYFVDQILELEPGRRALGVKHVTPADTYVRPGTGGAPVLLSCIIGEALGQLGAWSVMAARDFAVRPVAGVVGEVAITGEAAVGDTIVLDTTIDSVTDDAVHYHAVASVDGETILRLENALGPLLPIEQFNDSVQVRALFDRIALTGAPPELSQAASESTVSFDPSFDEVLTLEPGNEATALRALTGREAFLADHFPRKPVLPLSLLLESLLQLGGELLDDGGPLFAPTGARKVKMNRFVEPGDVLVATLKVAEQGVGSALVKFRCEMNGGRVCVGQASYSRSSGGNQ